MANAPVVYTGNNPNGTSGTLFEGKKFWLSHNVPQRSRFKELIQNNGGVVVLQEKEADIKLVDHTKKEVPLDTYSYQYVERSIRNGRLEDLEAHRAGKTTRPVGAHGIPSRSHRIPFTLEDDQLLWDYMQPLEEAGKNVSGNVFYQQLAEKYSRHTYQSWRSRYLKYLRGRPRPGGPRQNANPEDERNPTDGAHNNQTVPSDARQLSSHHQTETLNGPSHGVENLPTSGREGDSVPRNVSPSRSSMRSTRSPERAREITSTRQGSPPAVKFHGSFHTQPQTPNIPDRRATTSQISPMPTNRNHPVERRNNTAAVTTGEMTVTAENTKKRKRLSAEDDPAIPSFDAEDLTKRATDYIPQIVPSTPNQSPPVKTETVDESSQDATSDEADAANLGTAPRPQSTFRKTTSTPVQATSALLPEEEANLNALMELPFPPVLTSDSEDVESTTKDDGDEEAVHDLDEWIEERLRTRKVNEEQILTALRCTTMDQDLADRVLDHLAAGKGIPRDMRGVWTAEDDACLEGTNARDIERLLKKHGTKLYNKRFKYLEIARAAMLPSS